MAIERASIVPPVRSSTESKPHGRNKLFNSICPTCKVSGVVTEALMLKLLDKGLKSNGYQIVPKPGYVQGSPAQSLAPLVRMLREKGIRVI